MTFTVDKHYKYAVQNFPWNENVSINPLNPNEFIHLVKEIGEKIIKASESKPLYENLNERDFKLTDICYFIVQFDDRQTGNSQTVVRMQKPSEVEKTILTHTVQAISQTFKIMENKLFNNIKEKEIKAMTLLFGIHRVYNIAQNIIECPQPADQIQETETALTELTQNRERYVRSDQLSEQAKDCLLARVDQMIKEQIELLAALKISLQD